MKSITRTVSALVFAGTVLASSAAWAGLPSRVGTPFDVANRAYRGQLDGIPGYASLRSSLRSGKISGEAILQAAGVDVNSRDANLVEAFLRDSDQGHN